MILKKSFIKNSCKSILPLSIIRTNIDLLKMKIPNNNYITNIESGSKTIQYIYDDLSYLIKKIELFMKKYLDFTSILKKRLKITDEIIKSLFISYPKFKERWFIYKNSISLNFKESLIIIYQMQ